MNYVITSFTIKELMTLIESNRIDLKPYYQRNEIWSKNDQQDLIDSIIKGYPLPNFFIYKKNDFEFEMVDGQQRSKTIFKFYSNQIINANGKLFEEIDMFKFLDYKLSITIITDITSPKELEGFYVLVNKKGKHLTTPELYKAEYASTNFLKLVESLLEYQSFVDLNIFTDNARTRMNDRDFVEELVAYLKFGIQEKKIIIETIYSQDITIEESGVLEVRFKNVIDKIKILDKILPISKTRFKQRNDFYTLFNFIHQNLNESLDLLKEQYKSLITISEYISPSNDDCPPLREYAINCVSQSNSKTAREARLTFFNNLLKNSSKDLSKNKTIAQIFEFINENNLFEVSLIPVDGYFLIKYN